MTTATRYPLSTLRSLREFCNDLTSSPAWRDVFEALNDPSTDQDFTVDGVRFISSDQIDQTQQDELSSDLYCLGCFNEWFLADILDIDVDVIQAMQKAEAFEALGKLIISMDKLPDLQSAYASSDGYGHHFNGYDGSEEEFTINGTTYHVFDCR